jgi:hypothetical protein
MLSASLYVNLPEHRRPITSRGCDVASVNSVAFDLVKPPIDVYRFVVDFVDDAHDLNWLGHALHSLSSVFERLDGAAGKSVVVPAAQVAGDGLGYVFLSMYALTNSAAT